MFMSGERPAWLRPISTMDRAFIHGGANGKLDHFLCLYWADLLEGRLGRQDLANLGWQIRWAAAGAHVNHGHLGNGDVDAMCWGRCQQQLRQGLASRPTWIEQGKGKGQEKTYSRLKKSRTEM